LSTSRRSRRVWRSLGARSLTTELASYLRIEKRELEAGDDALVKVSPAPMVVR
jgi:hypothetical protein